MMHWGDYGCGAGYGWIWMVLFWGLVIAGLVYLVQTITGRAGKSSAGETSLDILKKRYARGEISHEEFDRMKDELMKS